MSIRLAVSRRRVQHGHQSQCRLMAALSATSLPSVPPHGGIVQPRLCRSQCRLMAALFSNVSAASLPPHGGIVQHGHPTLVMPPRGGIVSTDIRHRSLPPQGGIAQHGHQTKGHAASRRHCSARTSDTGHAASRRHELFSNVSATMPPRGGKLRCLDYV